MKQISILLLAAVSMILSGCVATGGGASGLANMMADHNRYQSVNYVNSDKKGPYIVVIPGEIKSAHATFTQKVTANNIADYAENELSQANFRVLERSDLGSALREVQLAFEMGDRRALQKFKRGKFKTTQWLVRFDILKAEPAAEATTSFDLGTIAGILGSKINPTASGVMHSTGSSESARVWLVGVR